MQSTPQTSYYLQFDEAIEKPLGEKNISGFFP